MRASDRPILISSTLAFSCVVIGLVVLFGWILNIHELRDPVPGDPPVAVASAVCFMLCGLSLLCRRFQRELAARAMATGVVLIATFIFAHYWIRGSFDLEQLLFRDQLLPSGQLAPGRMSSNTSFIMMLLGIAVGIQSERWVKLTDTFVLLVLSLSFIALMANVYGVQQALIVPASTPIAGVTAFVMIALAAALVLLRPALGFVAELSTEAIGGATARRVLPLAILVPIIAGGVRVSWSGVYSANMLTSMFVAAMVFLLSVIIWWTSRWLNSAERQRDQAEEQLRLTNENNRLIVDRANDAFVRVNEKGAITDWNPSAEAMFGWSKTEICGLLLHETIIAESDSEPHGAELLNFLSASEAHVVNGRIEIAALRKTGQQFPVELSIFPIQFGGEKTVGAFIHDITVRKAAERRISEFISTVSHELRTPLTSIKGALRIIQGGFAGDLSPRATALVDVATSETERLIRLVNDILDLRKVEAGKLDLRFTNVDIAALVSRALAAVHGMASDSEVVINEEVFAHGAVRCDEDRTIQVMANLLSNAIKFSSKGALVTVRVANGSPPMVRFSVIDRGPGIAEGEIPKLFSRFQQLDSADNRQKGGTGLGLAISKAIVEEHGGRIGVDSEPGKETTFWFELSATTG